jgi:hypothetical protein
MRRLVFGNMIYNALFVLMAPSEMTGLTEVHGALPWWLKWLDLCAGSRQLRVSCRDAAESQRLIASPAREQTTAIRSDI